MAHIPRMSTVAEIEEAISRLPSDEFARLLEDLRDIETARACLNEASKAGEHPATWNQLRQELRGCHALRAGNRR